MYKEPKQIITLEKIQKWGAVQVVKAFLGIPVIPGRQLLMKKKNKKKGFYFKDYNKILFVQNQAFNFLIFIPKYP